MKTSNFIAFCLWDNDFHDPLRKAIQEVYANAEGPLSVEAWRSYVAFATNMYAQLRHISQYWFDRLDLDNTHTMTYLHEKIAVSFVDRLDALENFQGYVIDTNLKTVYFYTS